MKLSLFISQNLECILVDWEAFARTQEPSATHMSSLALRDHAKLILTTIAAEIETSQTASHRRRSRAAMPPKNPAPKALRPSTARCAS